MRKAFEEAFKVTALKLIEIISYLYLLVTEIFFILW